MKKRFSVMVVALLLCCSAFILAACGDDTVVVPEPKEITETEKSFTLDLSGVNTREITIADYIDENGAQNVTYETAKDNDKVTVSDIEGGKFTVTGVETGTAVVTLNALQDGAVKVSVSFDVTITEPSEPEPEEITGTEKSFRLQLSGVDTKEITIADFIDENGAQNVTYETAKDNEKVTVSDIVDGKFTVTGVEAGSAVVTLRALQDGAVKVSVSFHVTVAEAEPEPEEITGAVKSFELNLLGINTKEITIAGA